MADVRLTAINPEDSSVVPVACNAGGQLLVEEQGQGPQGEQGPPGPKGDDGDPFSGNFADDVTFGGSATFAGDVTVGNFNGNNSDLGVNNRSNGYIFVNSNAPDTASILSLKQNGVQKAVIDGGGSATFAGDKAGFTAEGYLWCTTVRGDTVMLDATSNGMGVWVEYSPTTRIDEIRDRLDANRGDTGERPTDTQ